MDHFGAELDLIRSSVGAYLTERDVIRVFGADARSFLQGQLTQDVAELTPGAFRWSFILSPKGRVEALCRVWGGHGEGEMLLDVEHGYGQLLVDRLNRFRLRVKAEVELLSWEILHLFGPDSLALAEETTAQMREVRSWSSTAGVELIGPSIAVPDDLFMVSAELVEAIRVRDRWPAMSNEIEGVEPAPLPNELGDRVYDTAIDFAKGCYTGQELVARTHSRGAAAPRQLVAVELDEATTVPKGSVVRVGEAKGTVTSSSISLDSGNGLVLALLGRTSEPPTTVTIEWEDGQEHLVSGKVLVDTARAPT